MAADALQSNFGLANASPSYWMRFRIMQKGTRDTDTVVQIQLEQDAPDVWHEVVVTKGEPAPVSVGVGYGAVDGTLTRFIADTGALSTVSFTGYVVWVDKAQCNFEDQIIASWIQS